MRGVSGTTVDFHTTVLIGRVASALRRIIPAKAGTYWHVWLRTDFIFTLFFWQNNLILFKADNLILYKSRKCRRYSVGTYGYSGVQAGSTRKFRCATLAALDSKCHLIDVLRYSSKRAAHQHKPYFGESKSGCFVRKIRLPSHGIEAIPSQIINSIHLDGEFGFKPLCLKSFHTKSGRAVQTCLVAHLDREEIPSSDAGFRTLRSTAAMRESRRIGFAA